MLNDTLRCGPAGWSYPHWNGVVYPRTKTRNFHPLEHLAQYFDALEINTSFYQSLRPEVTGVWGRKVSANSNFRFTAKLHHRFTHERVLDRYEISTFKEGFWPLLRAEKLGCLLMQFPWTFRFTAENREFLIQLRRAFHEFPLVAEMRHSSWMLDEALGTFKDYRIGFCNIDQPNYTRAMPPTGFLTSSVGYVRLHGRNPLNALGSFDEQAERAKQHDYLYSQGELAEWKSRIEHISKLATSTFVVFNNDAAGKSIVNALQIQSILGDTRHRAPAELVRCYPEPLAEFHASRFYQESLFDAA